MPSVAARQPGGRGSSPITFLQAYCMFKMPKTGSIWKYGIGKLTEQ